MESLSLLQQGFKDKTELFLFCLELCAPALVPLLQIDAEIHLELGEMTLDNLRALEFVLLVGQLFGLCLYLHESLL